MKQTVLFDELKRFGFSIDESAIYTFLLQNPKSSATKISKSLRVPRTRVYRYLEKLIQKAFVIEVHEGFGKKYVASTYEKLNRIIEEKETKLSQLKDSAPKLFNELAQLSAGLDTDSNILTYRGEEGLKQVTWNSLKAKDVLRIYEISTMDAMFEREFAEKVRHEFGKLGTKIHQLTNLEEVNMDSDQKVHIDHSEVRFLNPKELEIRTEVIIYNNVYTAYTYEDGDVFIVEIYNEKLATMQKQLFDFIWSKAKGMERVDDRGRFRVK